MKKSNGSIEVEAVMALIIIDLFITIMVNGLYVLFNHQQVQMLAQNALDISLLQRICSFADNFYVEDDCLTFDYNQQTWQLKLVNNNLVLTPGSQYFASQVDNVRFQKVDDIILCYLTVGNNERMIALAYQ